MTVTECNEPLRVSTAQRVNLLAQPWRLPLLFGAIVRCWIRLIGQRRHLPQSEAVLVGHLGQFDIHLAHWLFRHQPLVLDYMISGSDTARDRGVRGGFKLRLLTWLDNAALRTADIVLVDTKEHAERLPAQYRHKAVVVAVGASNSWFEQVRTSDIHSPLKVIFFGNYTPLQGAPTITKALSRLTAPLSVTMVGRGQEEAATKRAVDPDSPAAITWHDWIEPDKLIELVAEHDICLGIFGTGPKGYRVVPNKIYQGAAVGCALITSDTPPQRRALDDAALFIPAGDDQALQTELERLMAHPKEVAKLQKAAQDRARRDFTPEVIVQPLLAKLSSR